MRCWRRDAEGLRGIGVSGLIGWRWDASGMARWECVPFLVEVDDDMDV